MTLTVPQNHASVTLTLREGTRTLGTVTRRNLSAGAANLRVRLSASGSARLSKAGTKKVSIKLTKAGLRLTKRPGTLS